jgi:hypothetical protein
MAIKLKSNVKVTGSSTRPKPVSVRGGGTRTTPRITYNPHKR